MTGFSGTATTVGWRSYTPSLTAAGGGAAIGGGTLTGAFQRDGQMVSFRVTLSLGSGTTFGSGGISLTVPIQPLASQRWVFPVDLWDVSAGNIYASRGVYTTGLMFALQTGPSTAGGPDRMVSGSAGVPFTWAAPDVISVNGSYEVGTGS